MMLIYGNVLSPPLFCICNIGSNYSNLEYDLDENKRGGRLKKFKKIINRLTKAENALVINNNAAAVFLALRAICNNKEVLVSRSESVEIGGGFRIPDVLIESNAILIDVGTTNKTYVEDYESKISENTGCILLVHQSNFKIEGFTQPRSGSLHSTRRLPQIGT